MMRPYPIQATRRSNTDVAMKKESERMSINPEGERRLKHTTLKLDTDGNEKKTERKRLLLAEIMSGWAGEDRGKKVRTRDLIKE
jgi:hypothetical protein